MLDVDHECNTRGHTEVAPNEKQIFHMLECLASPKQQLGKILEMRVSVKLLGNTKKRKNGKKFRKIVAFNRANSALKIVSKMSYQPEKRIYALDHRCAKARLNQRELKIKEMIGDDSRRKEG